MRKALLFCFAFFPCLIGNAQSIKHYVKHNFQEIASIDSNDSIEADFSGIGNAIGNSQVVFLGEQDHGDTKTMQAKIQLIKYLHEKHGFNVVAFESDFFGLNSCPPANQMDNIYSIWRGCEEFQDLNRYIESTTHSENPIQITGFDSNHHSAFSKQHLIAYCDSLFRTASLPFTNSPNYQGFLNTIDHVVQNEYKSELTFLEQRHFYQYMDTVQSQLELSEVQAKDFWTQELTNLRQMVHNCLVVDPDKTIFSNVRDLQMAENLLWLVNTKYKDQKVIVWAASFHIAKNIMQVEDYKYYVDNFESENFITTGGVFDRHFKGQSYHLGFTSSIRNYRFGTVEKPWKGSLESILLKKKSNFGFIDFSKAPPLEPFDMNGTNHTPYTSDWTQNFDGIFYIREMNSCYYNQAEP